MRRIDVVQEQMVRPMPLPAPEGAYRIARIRLAAAALATDITYGENPTTTVPCHETQVEIAINQMSLGTTRTRTDENPDTWDESGNGAWRFETTIAELGSTKAAGIFLNRWGKILQVPRNEGESDDSYRVRIVQEVVAPATTNFGLADMVDRLLGTAGTRVVEGDGFFPIFRLNDGHRLNNGSRLMGIGAYGADSLWNTFVVILAGAAPTAQEEKALRDLIDRRRGAGNRLLAIVSSSI